MCINDNKYYDIVEDIIESDNLRKLKYIKHHGRTRYEHSLKVSYYSYKLAKKFGLKYKEVARAGLLHDLFYEENEYRKEKFSSFFTHPKKALKNAKKYYKLNKIEQNIIEAHMFPIGVVMPKYKESYLVSTVDKVVAITDFTLTKIYNLRFIFSFVTIFASYNKFYKKNWVFMSN